MRPPADHTMLLLDHLGAALRGRLRDGTADRDARAARRRALSRAFGALFVRLLPPLAPTLLIEVGAHDAAFSRAAKKALPDARAIAFEANAEVAVTHSAAAAQDGVDYRNLAVAAAPGTVTLHVPARRRRADRLRTASLLPEAAPDTATETRAVAATSLDAFLGDEAARPNALWIDVEGAAGLVLAGAAGTLAACVALHIELETEAAWAGQALDGEIVRTLATHGLHPVLRDMPGKTHYNAIFLRDTAWTLPAVRDACRAFLEAPIAAPARRSTQEHA